jgi:tetratricopeptide (TPR) repeat protein
MERAAQSFRELDNRLGGGRVRSAVMQYLTDEITPVLAQGQFSADIGTRLAGVAAELAQLAGWVAYDTGLHGHAERYLTLALSFARHAGDDGLGAEILAAKAHQAVYLGRPAEAVDLARAAQVTARRAALPTLLAECCVMEAHGHAAANNARACARALSDAETAFERSARHNDPGWLRYFDEAYLAARMAHCFRDLGESRHAEHYARRSLDMDGRFVRGKAFNLSLLATTLADQGDIEQACAVGAQAVDLAAGLRSVRSVQYIRTLQRALRGAADAPAVRELTDRVEQCLPAALARAARR